MNMVGWMDLILKIHHFDLDGVCSKWGLITWAKHPPQVLGGIDMPIRDSHIRGLVCTKEVFGVFGHEAEQEHVTLW